MREKKQGRKRRNYFETEKFMHIVCFWAKKQVSEKCPFIQCHCQWNAHLTNYMTNCTSAGKTRPGETVVRF